MALRLNREQTKAFQEAFHMFDLDGDERITSEELKEVLVSLGRSPSLTELRAMIDDVDRNRNGSVEFQEFLELILGQPVYLLSQEEEEILEAFKVFDPETSGYISVSKLRFVLTKIGKSPLADKRKVEELLVFADGNNDGRVEYEDCVRRMFETET